MWHTLNIFQHLNSWMEKRKGELKHNILFTKWVASAGPARKTDQNYKLCNIRHLWFIQTRLLRNLRIIYFWDYFGHICNVFPYAVRSKENINLKPPIDRQTKKWIFFFIQNRILGQLLDFLILVLQALIHEILHAH